MMDTLANTEITFHFFWFLLLGIVTIVLLLRTPREEPAIQTLPPESVRKSTVPAVSESTR